MGEIRKTSGYRPPKYWVEQYTLDGEFVARYAGLQKANDATGIHYSQISLCANGKKAQACGYVFKYKPITYEDLENDGDTDIHNEKPFDLYYKDQFVGRYDDKAQCCKDTGMSRRNVGDLLRGRYPSYCGYTVLRVNEENTDELLGETTD